MSNDNTAAIPDIASAKAFIAEKLTASGFLAAQEFSDIDSLEHRKEQLGFYSLKDCTQSGSCLHHEDGDIFTQTDCVFEIKLMGTCSGFSDYLKFDSSCQELYVRLLIGTGCIVRSAKLGKVFQSVPLNRLERDLTLTLRLCIREPYTASQEIPRFHRGLIGEDTVIYPSSIDISRKERTVTLNTVDGRLITVAIAQELMLIEVRGCFTFDERDYYLAMVDELSGVSGIDFEADGVLYEDITVLECSADFKEGELLGSYSIKMGGRTHDMHS